MSRILDGPAGPVALANGRAPIFLRVVIDQAGKVDCLDRLEDLPSPGEAIHVYELVPGTYHGVALVRVARPATCVEMADGDYRHRPDVDGETVRDTEAWRAWCRAQPLPGQTTTGLLEEASAGWAIPIGWTRDNEGFCRSSVAEILWCVTPAGKKAPIDRDGRSHFATCPQADQWRKRGAS